MYAWRGRTSRGQELTGEIEAGSKDAAIDKLRLQRILVLSLVEGRAARGVAEPWRHRAAAMRLVMGALVLVGAAAVLSITSLTRIRCARSANERVDCSVQTGPLGASPLPVQPAFGVTAVAVEERIDVTKSITDRQAASLVIRRVVLRGGQGSVVTAWMSYPLGGSADEIERRLNAFLTTPSETEVRIWQMSPFVLLSAALCLVGLFLLITSVRRLRAGRDRPAAVTPVSSRST